MAVRSIRENADTALREAIQGYAYQSSVNGALLCRFSLSPQPLQSDAMLAATAGVIGTHKGELYFLNNRDVLVVWQGPLAQIAATLKNVIRGHFRGIVTKAGETSFFQFYNLQEQGSALVAALSSGVVPPDPVPSDVSAVLEFTPAQLETLKQGIRDRNSARGFEAMGLNILIVEDQEFSLKLMNSLLSREHHCATAQTAAEALERYAKQPPDILFLDVELPDASGHDLAAFIKQHDPESHIIMVTANNDAKDVNIARRNAVQGYITKPFRQQKIRASVDGFIERNKV